jgi:hypothetical protein
VVAQAEKYERIRQRAEQGRDDELRAATLRADTMCASSVGRAPDGESERVEALRG